MEAYEVRMMRLIDADKFYLLLRKYSPDANSYDRGWDDAIFEIVEHAPTIDAVEVVHCKDCIFGRTGENVGVGKWNIDCLNPNISKYRLPTDYCSYGEKREE